MARSHRIYLVTRADDDSVTTGVVGCFTVKWEAIGFAESMSEALGEELVIWGYPDGRYLPADDRSVRTEVWRSTDGE